MPDNNQAQPLVLELAVATHWSSARQERNGMVVFFFWDNEENISMLPKPKPSRFLQIGILGFVVSHFLTKVVCGPFFPPVFIVSSQHKPYSGFSD